MKKTLFIGILAATTGFSAVAADYQDQAQVLDVQPMYGVQQQCAPQQYGYQQQRATGTQDVGATILGGLAGAAVGSQIGKGKGNTAAIALGTVTGAAIGNNMAQGGNQQGSPIYQQQGPACQQVQVITGNRVTFAYGGRTFTEQWGPMAPQPGTFFNVRVSVRPL